MKTIGSDEDLSTKETVSVSAQFKNFLSKTANVATSLISKPVTHVCKVTIGTPDDKLVLTVSDGSFASQVREFQEQISY